MLKPLLLINLLLLLLSVNLNLEAMPIPVDTYLYQRDNPRLFHPPLPLNELTWLNWLKAWQIHLPGTIATSVAHELRQLPDHLLKSIQATIINNVPNYVVLLSTLTYIPSRRELYRIYLIHNVIRIFTMAYSLFSTREEGSLNDEFLEPGQIGSDSVLLNSLMLLYRNNNYRNNNYRNNDTQSLTFSPNAWPVELELSPNTSPLIRNLVQLHREMNNKNLQYCTLNHPISQDSRTVIEFCCSVEQNNQCDISGYLELFSYCDTDFISEASECSGDLAQSSIINCLNSALAANGDPLTSVHPCLLPYHSTYTNGDVKVKEISVPDDKQSPDFLVNAAGMQFILSGQYPELHSIDAIIETFSLPLDQWPVLNMDIDQVLQPLSDTVYRATRLATLQWVNQWHQGLLDYFFFNIDIEEAVAPPSLEEPNESAPPPIDFNPEEPVITITEPTQEETVTSMTPAIVVTPDPIEQGTSAFTKDTSPDSEHLSPTHIRDSRFTMRRGSFALVLPYKNIFIRRRSLPPLNGRAKDDQWEWENRNLWKNIPQTATAPIKPNTVITEPQNVLAHPAQGIIKEHFNMIRIFSRFIMAGIFLRPVNPANLDLGPLRYPTKDLSLKPKTANNHFGNGFIPDNPIYSKLLAFPEKIPKAKMVIQTLYKLFPERFIRAQLQLQQDRLEHLLHSASSIKMRTNDVIKAEFKMYGNPIVQRATRVDDTENWLIWEESGDPYQVIAHPKHGPYIADYDPSILAPLYSHHVIEHTDPEYAVIIDTIIPDYSGNPIKHPPLTVTQKEDLKNLESGSFSTAELELSTRGTLEREVFFKRHYYQSQLVKPADLGGLDRLPLTEISPSLILQRVELKLKQLASELQLSTSELPVRLSALSPEHYSQIHDQIHDWLITGLVHHFHPGHQVDNSLLTSPPEQLPTLWQTLFPESKPVITTPRSKLNPLLTSTSYRKMPIEMMAVYRARSLLLLLKDAYHYLDPMDKKLGSLTPRMQQTIKQLNIMIDRGKGRGMFHHGFDSANPFSNLEDLFPATGATPFDLSWGNTVLVHNPEGLKDLIISLKDQGAYVQTNPLWGKEFITLTRSRRFIWALNCLQGKASVDDAAGQYPLIVLPPHWPLNNGGNQPESYTVDWPLNDPEALESLHEKIGHCLAPYLYTPWVKSHDNPHPTPGFIRPQPLISNPANDIAD